MTVEHGIQTWLDPTTASDDQIGFALSPIAAANVSSVPQRSPLRYPGGKTWLIPHVRAWLGGVRPAPSLLIEPFAGGGIVSLTAVMEGLVSRCLMAELDRDVAAFWHAALRHRRELTDRIRGFTPTRECVDELASRPPRDELDHGFRTLVLNRTRRGGILAPGASLSKEGEDGKGIASRWYPDTLIRRLEAVGDYSDRITFCETDGMLMLDTILSQHDQDIVVFVDPPYTAGGKRAGRRLYAHSDIDHERLFEILDTTRANFLMTYDYSPEILALIDRHGFHAVRVDMKNTHHALLPELIITPTPVFSSLT